MSDPVADVLARIGLTADDLTPEQLAAVESHIADPDGWLRRLARRDEAPQLDPGADSGVPPPTPNPDPGVDTDPDAWLRTLARKDPNR